MKPDDIVSSQPNSIPPDGTTPKSVPEPEPNGDVPALVQRMDADLVRRQLDIENTINTVLPESAREHLAEALNSGRVFMFLGHVEQNGSERTYRWYLFQNDFPTDGSKTGPYELAAMLSKSRKSETIHAIPHLGE